jgi:hypothetical protein
MRRQTDMHAQMCAAWKNEQTSPVLLHPEKLGTAYIYILSYKHVQDQKKENKSHI